MSRHFLPLLKYLLAFGALGLVLAHADLARVLAHLKQASLLYLVLAWALIVASQTVNAMRMRYYYEQSGVPLSPRFAVALYFVGMFYNIFLPGSVGGDAYRVWLLKRRGQMGAWDGVRVQLSGRASSMIVTLLMLLGMLWSIPLKPAFDALCILAAMLGALLLAAYFISVRWLLKEPFAVASGALPYSVIIQSLTVLGVACMWASLGHMTSPLPVYLLLFLASIVAGVIPITVGGVGLREMIFFYGAHVLSAAATVPVDPELAVAVGLLFSVLNMAVAALGLLWLHAVSKMDQERPIET